MARSAKLARRDYVANTIAKAFDSERPAMNFDAITGQIAAVVEAGKPAFAMVTPDERRVPRVRVKRATAIFRSTGPMMGRTRKTL